MDAATNNSRRLAAADILAAGVLILAVAVRVWAAWAERCITNADSSVVALMARHLAAFKDFPVFFYGQAYMGSLEPLASALMIRLLGATGFAVNLGPVLFAAAALAVLWWWARIAAGPRGGLAALLAALFGPAVYFQFQTAPRGGYMVALFVDALAVVLAARLAAGLREQERISGWRWAVLGLVAGVGMWSNMIVLAGLLAAGLLLLLGMRGQIWRHLRGIGAGLAGFMAGFSPWLAWNLGHGWGSLAMSQFGQRAPPLESLRNSWTRFLWLQDAGVPFFRPAPAILALALLGLAALGAWAAWRQRRKSTPRENYARAGAVLFCAMFMAIYVAAGVNTTRTARYWVPLAPGLAVLGGMACAVPGTRIRHLLGWGILLPLVGVQGLLCGMAIRLKAAEAEPNAAAYREIGAVLARAGADAFLAPIQMYPLNFALGERLPVSNGRQKYYEPILREAELAERPAFASDYAGIGVFLQLSGATWEQAAAGGRQILWNAQRPAMAVQAISAGAIAALQDGQGASRRDALLDGNFGTWWSPDSGRDREPAPVLEWSFAEPADVHSLYLLFTHGMADPGFAFPRGIGVEVKTGGTWLARQPDLPTIPLEWSGPRVYPQGGFARVEVPVRAEDAEGLRVVFRGTSTGREPWRLAEATVFAPATGAPPAMDIATLDELGERLGNFSPEAVVYAPRWVSNQLFKRGWIPEHRLAGLSAWIFPSPALPRDGTVPAGESFVGVVTPLHMETTRTTLRNLGVEFREEPAGPWTVFAVSPPPAGGGGNSGRNLPVRWTGEALLADSEGMGAPVSRAP